MPLRSTLLAFALLLPEVAGAQEALDPEAPTVAGQAVTEGGADATQGPCGQLSCR